MDSSMHKNKVFCIGLNKTGTTSIGDALKILGYKRFGWRPEISARLVTNWHEKNLAPFSQVIENHDAFEDLPWPLMFKELDERYPDAKFVLTIRSDEETWLKSMQKHIQRGSNWVGHYLIYGSYDPIKDKSLYIDKYRSHNSEIRNYFANRPDKLVEMCFENGDSWEKLCKFLKVDKAPNVPFPHSNPAKIHETREVEQQAKVFCIGLNKTGSTSVGDALEILGYKRIGWRPNVSAQLVTHWHEGKLSPFLRILKKYDAFDNLPWPLVYKELEELYPEAKFILTLSSDESTWIDSIQKHIRRDSRWVGHFLVYGSYDPVDDKALFLKKYESHNNDVREYFSNKPGKLAEMCLETGDGWDNLCAFLGRSQKPCEKFPSQSE